jgi:chaperonin cofactor prefoldin
MNEQELKALEHAISRLDISITTLEGQRVQLNYQIEELKKIQAILVRLLPPGNRLERLFP